MSHGTYQPRADMHRWLKMGTGRFCDRACVACGLVARVQGESTRKDQPKGSYPVMAYSRGNLNFGVQKKVPPCAPPFNFDRAKPITFTLDGYAFSIKKLPREVQPFSTQKIAEPESESVDRKT